MSRTMTISSWSASNVTVRCCDGSSRSPAKISSYISAMRLGVRARPSRSGSSPIASRISRTARSTRGLSTSALASGVTTWIGSVTAVPSVLLGSGGRAPRRARARRVGRGGSRRPAHAGAGERLDAGEDRLHPLDLERLVIDQLRRHLVENGAVGLEDLARDRVRALDQAAHLVVDARRDLVAVVGRRVEVAAEEHLTLGLPE